MLIGFVAIHLLMVVKLGINEWPMPGRVVKRATYLNEYHELHKKRRRTVRSVRHLERFVSLRHSFFWPSLRALPISVRSVPNRPARTRP